MIFSSVVLSVLICILIHPNGSAYIAHLLNNLFNLPHPGPEDIQGSCYCRQHEGPNKYTFKDYINYVLS